jgi:Cd2+/Zn2+-exporting ATPase
MGRRVVNKIIQNVAFSLFVKFIVLGFALTGRASLWAAIASDVGAMILVTLNGMSLLPLRRKKESSSVPVTASITANVNVVNGGV